MVQCLRGQTNGTADGFLLNRTNAEGGDNMDAYQIFMLIQQSMSIMITVMFGVFSIVISLIIVLHSKK